MKKSLALLLCAVLLLPPLATLPFNTKGSANDAAAGYEDVSSAQWYYAAVSFVIQNGYMGSTTTSELRFEPDTTVSRAMVASILYRIAGSPEVSFETAFTDVPAGKWFTNAVAWCAQNGLAAGRGEGVFDPDGAVTRQELAVFLMKMAGFLADDTESRNDLSAFSDADEVPSWARPWLQRAVDAGIISGKLIEGKMFLTPIDNATRAELASMIMRLMKKNKTSIENILPDTELETLFSFRYDGKDSSEFIGKWTKQSTVNEADNGVSQQVSWTDPDSGLRVTLQLLLYYDSDAVEWSARVENTSDRNTPLVEKFQIADFDYRIEDPNISFSKGTDIRKDDFLFVKEPLRMYANRTFSPKDGRSTSGDCMPYFNLISQDEGLFVAIGWSGQWQASFKRTSTGVHIAAGMQKTRFFLYPGESVRTPSITVLKWNGSEERSYNLWRAHMIAEHTPKDENGNVVTLPISNGAWGGDAAQTHINTIRYINTCGYPYDAYWIDAGWYGDENRHSDSQFGDEWFQNAGDWYHNTTLYPDGLMPISEAAHNGNMDLLLWFEPERAWWDSKLVTEHPEWFLKCGEEENTSFVFNMGDPAACEWMTEFISQKIQEYGVDIYRQDFNVAPLPYWEAADATDRQGITEMKYIEGLYTFLQGLKKRNPNLILDNCAGGGRRLDYEMLSLALPLFRSDYQCFNDYQTTPCQVQTDGLSHWVPLSGTCTQFCPEDTYSFRSNLAYAIQTPATDRTAWQTAMLEQFHAAQPFYTGEFYRISDHDIQSDTVWYAYQMHSKDTRSGFVLAFRRERAGNRTETVSLYVPDSVKSITFLDADTGERWTVSAEKAEGNHLSLPLSIDEVLETKLLFYEMN